MPRWSRMAGTNRSGRSGSTSLPDECFTAISHADAALRNTSWSG